jgi:hypothetical protein
MWLDLKLQVVFMGGAKFFRRRPAKKKEEGVYVANSKRNSESAVTVTVIQLLTRDLSIVTDSE